MRIRLLQKKDIDDVAMLFVEAYKKEDKKRRWEIKFAKEYILNMYRLCKDLCFVAVQDGDIVGVSLSIVVPDFNKYIISSKALIVHPKFRKQKIGSRLLRKTCIKALNKYNIKEIETSVYTLTNFPITWYERMGFRNKKNYELTKGKIDKILQII